jgi:hypothetical protein
MIANYLRFALGTFVLSAFLSSAAAQQAEQRDQPKRSQLVITLRASRVQVPAGVGFGITADITNKSDTAVFLVPEYVTMTPPPEIDPEPPPQVWFALLPGMQFKDDGEPNYESVVRLGPGDTTSAFWAGGSIERNVFLRALGELRLINFSPGEYNIKVVALYWPDQESANSRAYNYDTENAEIKLNVIAPQWVIIVGSVIGGLIAYFLLPSARVKTREYNFFGILTAILLSLIVTVLLARVSETQFLVRITVNDVWGAIAIGFIANASGIALLKKYVPSLRLKEEEQDSSARTR